MKKIPISLLFLTSKICRNILIIKKWAVANLKFQS